MLGKGAKKRKRSEEEAGPSALAPGSSLFTLSVSKLHQSLGHVEPDLRHLVLVTNTLRRLQEEMGLTPRDAPATASTVSGPGALDTAPCSLQDSCRNSLPPSENKALLSSADLAVFSTVLEGLSNFGDATCPTVNQPDGSLAPERTFSPCALETLAPSSYLLEDGLEDVFEDIDTSMRNYPRKKLNAAKGVLVFPQGWS
uniref:SERTA domain-containing protein n=1 Tax=Salvator merianae TaxID=96440 RepID=A0A8D0B530_SALMN